MTSRSKSSDSSVPPAAVPAVAASDPLEQLLRCYLDEFITHNKAARVVASGLRVVGVGLWPLVDHLTFRAVDIAKRAGEFCSQGYHEDKTIGMLEGHDWWGKVFRKTGYPSLLIEQPFAGKRGEKSVVLEWIHQFGDKQPHHLAIRVDNLTQAMYFMEKQGIPFSYQSSATQHSADFKRVFTEPSRRDGKSYSMLELIERHRGFAGFAHPLLDAVHHDETP